MSRKNNSPRSALQDGSAYTLGERKRGLLATVSRQFRSQFVEIGRQSWATAYSQLRFPRRTPRTVGRPARIVGDSGFYGTHPPVKAQPVVTKERECNP